MPTLTETPRGAHVAVDMPCLQCGYNLRTLAVSARCPECGRAVEKSWWWHAQADRTALGALRTAADALAWAPLAAVAVVSPFVLLTILTTQSEAWCVGIAFGFALCMLYFVGSCAFMGAVHRLERRSRPRFLDGIAIAVLLTVGISVSLPNRLGAVAGLLSALGLTGLWTWTATGARQVANYSGHGRLIALARACVHIGVTSLVVLAGLLICLMALLAVYGTSGSGYAFVCDYVSPFAIVLGPLGTGGLNIALMFRLRRWLSRTSSGSGDLLTAAQGGSNAGT